MTSQISKQGKMANKQSNKKQAQQTAIVSYKNINPLTDLIFGNPKVNKVGGRNVSIKNKNTKENFMVSAPIMLTWGINEYVDEKTGKVTYDMSLQFPTEEYETPQSVAFKKMIEEYETTLKSAVRENCREWLNRPSISDEGIDLIWNPLLRYPKDKETKMIDYSRPPSIRLKLPVWEGKWNVELFDIAGNALFPSPMSSDTPETIVTKGINVACVLESGGIYFASGKCGTTLKLFQAVVQPKKSLRGTCHVILDNEDKAQMERSNEQSGETEEASKEAVAEIVDSDEEEANEVEVERSPSPEPEPEPAKKVVKKKVVKKKVAKKGE